MTDNLFDSIRDLLGDSLSHEDVVTTHGEVDHRIFKHPFIDVDDTGCPKILDYIFSSYFDNEQMESIRDEGRIASVQLRQMLKGINENADITRMLPDFLLGNYDRSADDAVLRWLARFTLCSGLLAIVSIIKGESPSKDGNFADMFEYRTAFAANDVIQVAKTIASPIRADYAMKKYPFMRKDNPND